MAGYRALVVSVLAHAAGLALIAWWTGGADRRSEGAVLGVDEPSAVPIELLPRPPARELEVAILSGAAIDAAEAAAAPAAASISGGAPARGGGAPGTGAGGELAGPGDAGVPGRPNPLAMRGLRHDLTLSGDALSRILQDRPLPEPVKPTGNIQPHGREGRINDAVASYAVHGDGTVDIHDKKDIDIHWLIPLPTPSRILRGAHELGEDLAAWKEDPYRDTRVGKMQDLPRHLQAVPGLCESFGDPMCDADPVRKVKKNMSGDGPMIGILGGGLDITSYLHRKFIGDPYSSRKLKMLDDTRAERVESGTAYRAAQLQRSAQLMAHNLEALWRATTDPAARREALFELWDECVEGEGPAGAAGERSRAMVIGWIAAHLPEGQPGAYSAEDIAQLDAKRSSKQHFAPY